MRRKIDHMAEIFYEFTHVHAYTYGKSQICLSPPPPTRKNKIISRTTPPGKIKDLINGSMHAETVDLW